MYFALKVFWWDERKSVTDEPIDVARAHVMYGEVMHIKTCVCILHQMRFWDQDPGSRPLDSRL